MFQARFDFRKQADRGSGLRPRGEMYALDLVTQRRQAMQRDRSRISGSSARGIRFVHQHGPDASALVGEQPIPLAWPVRSCPPKFCEFYYGETLDFSWRT